MPINFPTSLDTFTNPTSGDYLDSVTVPHYLQHADVNDAVEAIQAKLGIDSSAVATSIDYLLKNTSSIDPGHKHTTLWTPSGGTAGAQINASTQLVITGSGVLMGGDINLFRSAANTLRTDDSFVVGTNLTVNTLTSGRVPYASTNGLLVDSANMQFNGTQLQLPDTTTGGGWLLGGDVQGYRRSANILALATGDSMEIPTNLSVGTTISSNHTIYTTRTVTTNTTQTGIRSDLSVAGATTSAFPVAGNFTTTVTAGTGAVFFSAGVFFSNRSELTQSGTQTEQWGVYGDVWHRSQGNVGTFGGVRGYMNIVAGSAGTITATSALQGVVVTNAGGTQAAMTTISLVDAYLSHSGTGTITNLWGFAVNGYFSAGCGTITNWAGIRVNDPGANATITTNYGIYVADISRGSTNYGLYFAGTSGLARQGIWWNGDTNLYRLAANVLATDDTFKLALGTTAIAPLQFQNGTLLSSPTSGCMEVAGGQLYYTDGSGRAKVKTRATVPMLLMAGYTPTASGGDIIYKVPRVNGSSVTFNVRRLFWRVETAAAGESRIRVEKYTGTSAFSATNMHTGGDLSLSGGSTYEASTTTFTTTTLTSDDKVRVNVTLLNAQATWLVELELEEQ